MPGTYRYSATFDKPYVEEATPPRSPVRFSIGRWQGANAPESSSSSITTAVASSSATPVVVVENPPLNNGYRNNARTASTDSLDSGSCGSSTGSSSGGHSRQVSIEGMECLPYSRNSLSAKTTAQQAAAAAASRNPMQFVKVGPVPLYKKAEEQIKLVKETKICREKVKEHEEGWQTNLDGWKNRRRKLSEKSILRLEERKLIEEEEINRMKPTKIKTFTEMMEERAHKPRSYNLAIYVDNSEDDKPNSATENNDISEEPMSANSNRDSVFSNNDNDEDENEVLLKENIEISLSHEEKARNISQNENFNKPLMEEINEDEKNIISHKATASIDDGFAEEDCNGYSLYTGGDSGLESFGSSQRVGDLQDSCSELSTDSGSNYDRACIDEEQNGGHSEDYPGSKKANCKSWPANLEEKEGYVQLSLRMWMRPENKEKDFGFTLKVNKSETPTVTVESVKAKSVSHEIGLRKDDEILAVNGESAVGRSHSSLMFSVKQSLYRGHLDLIVSRPECEDSVEEFDPEEVLAKPRGPSERRLMNGRSVDDLSSKGNRDQGFRNRSKSESSRTRPSWLRRDDEQQQPQEHQSDTSSLKDTKKVPPPIPVKPKFKMAPNGRLSSVSLENLLTPTAQRSAVDEDDDDDDIVLKEREDNFLFNESRNKSSTNVVMDDTIESEVNYIEDSMTPLVRTLSDGFRNAAESPSFQNHLKQDEVCLSDYNENEMDVEKQLDAEMVVKDLQTCGSPTSAKQEWNANTLTQFVNVPVLQGKPEEDEEIREDSDTCSSIIEEQIVKVCVPEVDSFPIGPHGVSSKITLPTKTTPESHFLMSNHPLYRENGLNIIFQSHPRDYGEDEREIEDGDSRANKQAISHLEEIRRQSDDVAVAPDTQRNQPTGSSPSNSDLFLENGSSKDFVVERDKLFEDSDYFQSKPMNDSTYEVQDPLYTDEYQFNGLDDLPRQAEPPKEKPPPPPPQDSGDTPEKPHQNPIKHPVQKLNTFKRIKKEIWKRRSDFLGIDPADNMENVGVPSPPNMSANLVSERQNYIQLDKEDVMKSKFKPDGALDVDIIRREQEIIDNLEVEERKLRTQETENDEQELVSAENTVATIAKTEDDERIQRLKNERRRMEEERLQKEEQRMRMNDDSMFREREENLRVQEEHELRPPVSNNHNLELEFITPVNQANAKQTQLETMRSVSLDQICQPPLESMSKSQEALRIEREYLRKEQETLRKERDEYNRRLEIEQQKLLMQEQEKMKSTLPGRDAVIYASKKPQGYQDDFRARNSRLMARSRSSSELSLSSSQDSVKEVDLPSNHMLRTTKKEASPPKTRIIQNEQWISQSEKTAKRRSDPTVPRESIYNPNHWLVQEAEMRRISEQNERQQQQSYQSPDNRHSTPIVVHHFSSALHSPPVVGAPPPPKHPSCDALRHIASTAPRPYHKPIPPLPPPKPPHGLPAQKEPHLWNYRPVAAPVTLNSVTPVLTTVNSDLRHYRSDILPPPAPPVSASTPKSNHIEYEQEQLLSVSGKERCSHCGETLGSGGAMIIESLQLCYHMHCFCCCVCQAQLGNGTCGTDVRVRNHKLHCQNCYSNDEAGLKFSQV